MRNTGSMLVWWLVRDFHLHSCQLHPYIGLDCNSVGLFASMALIPDDTVPKATHVPAQLVIPSCVRPQVDEAQAHAFFGLCRAQAELESLH